MGVENFISKDNIFAVVGASADKEKFGYKVFMHLSNNMFNVYPVNPYTTSIEGHPVFENLSKVPYTPTVVITVTKPSVTEQIVKEAHQLGIKKIWMQPGSESKEAIDFCKKNKIECISKFCFVRDGLKSGFDV